MGGRIVAYRVFALSLLVVLYYSLDWMPLRTLLRDTVEWLLRAGGYEAQAFSYEGSPALRVYEKSYSYSAQCTYVDLFLTVAPFIWVCGASFRRNLAYLAVSAFAISGANLVRVWASVYFNVRGADYSYTHDLPDNIIWWPTLAVVVLWSLLRDVGSSFARVRQ